MPYIFPKKINCSLKNSFFSSFLSFTVVQSSQPVTVRAEYGPFETSQMVPTQYLVPDLMLEQEETEAGEAEAGKEGAHTHVKTRLWCYHVCKNNSVEHVI